MDVLKYADHPQLKSVVVVEGSAKGACDTSQFGLLDIGVSDKSYIFRVSLPGIRKDTSKLKCKIQRNGTVNIQGIMTVGDVVTRSSKVYNVLLQDLCPPGEFALSFHLPGPVEARLFYPTFRHDGVLEIIVMKERKYGKYVG